VLGLWGTAEVKGRKAAGRCQECGADVSKLNGPASVKGRGRLHECGRGRMYRGTDRARRFRLDRRPMDQTCARGCGSTWGVDKRARRRRRRGRVRVRDIQPDEGPRVRQDQHQRCQASGWPARQSR
jgi:hypothetical protein